MSYCRWSSDCYQSDVYVYEGDEGFVIHVANGRYESDTPRPELPENAPRKGFVKYYSDCISWAEKAHSVAIGLPFDGKTFTTDTPKEAADKLIELRGMGYYIPQYAIDRLLEEENE